MSPEHDSCGAMVLGHSVVMGVCDRGVKANWRDSGIVDRSSCLMVSSCWTDVSGSTKVSVEEWREPDMAGFARLSRYCWMERDGWDMMLFVLGGDSFLCIPGAFFGDPL